MRRVLTIAAVVCLAFGLVGCDAVQRKFTRKKKTPKKPKIYQLKRYEKIPTPELYNKHYVYWQTWSGDLISEVGQNQKKNLRCIEEMASNLRDMQNILVKEKADEMQVHIDRAEEARALIARGDMSFATKTKLKADLEREDRAIKRDFTTGKIKSFIKESFDDQTPPAQMTRAGEPVASEEAE